MAAMPSMINDRHMGVFRVSTTGESGETFPTRILTLEIYWGISPVKIRFRPEIDPLTFDDLFFVHKIWPLPKKVGQIRRFFSFW